MFFLAIFHKNKKNNIMINVHNYVRRPATSQRPTPGGVENSSPEQLEVYQYPFFLHNQVLAFATNFLDRGPISGDLLESRRQWRNKCVSPQSSTETHTLGQSWAVIVLWGKLHKRTAALYIVCKILNNQLHAS